MCFIFKIKAGAKFPVIQMKTESFREGMARDSAEEGERLWGWDGVNTKACLLYTSDAADDWLVV